MKKIILVFGVAFISSAEVFAENAKKMSRIVAREQDQHWACTEAAGNAVMGFVRALNQDVTIEKVVPLQIKSASEIFNVKLKGSGFTSLETNSYWKIVLQNTGSGCGFVSLSLSRAAG